MYEIMIPEGYLYYIVYGAVAMLALAAAGYLLLRRGNAFAPDITPPVRVRRWTAAFMAVGGLGHFYYLPIAYLSSDTAIRQGLFVASALDFLTFFPLAIIVMLTMLQDRRRPLWPVGVAMVPPTLGVAWSLISGSDAPLPAIDAYLALLGIALATYLLRALRQYGRWLRDNYADLEHKEVWQTFAVMAAILCMLGYYTFGSIGTAYEYIVQLGGAALICFLLWRVETLSDLSHLQALYAADEDAAFAEDDERSDVNADFEALLQRHCIDKRLYLQHDLSAVDLALAVGTNRTYLSRYFKRHGLTYNAYINGLRIDHFVSLYHETVAAGRDVTLQQLAKDSGYRSYSTFSLAFRQRMGQSVTAWTKAFR